MQMDYSKLGKRIAQRRKACGLKQARVCELCDLSDKYLSAIECARSIPSLDVLMRICEVLDTTPDALLLGVQHDETDEMRANVMQKARVLSHKQMQLLDSFVNWLVQHEM